jgi:hypothetical protein
VRRLINDYSVARVAELTGLSKRAVRWHCADPRGRLYGQDAYGQDRSYKVGRDWVIRPVAALELQHHLQDKARARGGPETESDPPR